MGGRRHADAESIGAIGVGLTVGLRKGGVLLSLLVPPLYIPVLIFATGAIDAASMGMPIDGYPAILGAMLAGSVTLGTVCHRGGAASERALANVLNEQTGQGRQERTPQKIFAVSDRSGRPTHKNYREH